MNELDFDFMKHQLYRKEQEIQELQSLVGELRAKYEQTKTLLTDLMEKQKKVDEQFELPKTFPEDTPA